MKPSTPRLSELARHIVIPEGIVTTGWPAVKAKAAELGIGYDPWQDSAGRVMLGKRADGKYAATVGGIVWSIPRQVGKTYTIGSLLMVMCILFPGLKVVWTAHRLRTATDTFRAMQAIAKRKSFAPHISHVRTANGEQEIGFANGSVIMFGAREQGFGRGFTNLDIEVFDEAQILGDKALEDMIAATNQARHPHGALLFYIGTPPRPVDTSEAFANKRRKALELEATSPAGDMFYLELSADPASDLDDRSQWPTMNPSYPRRTPLESMLRLRENLPSDDAWNREGRGVWDPDGTADLYSLTDWQACFSGTARQPRGSWVLAVDVNPHRTAATVAAVGTGADGRPLVFVHVFADVSQVVPFLKRQALKRSVSEIALHAQGQSGALLPDLKEAGLEAKVQTVSTTHLGQSCAAFLRGIKDHAFSHAGQPELSSALQLARTRRIGSGEGELFAEPRDEITPVIAASVALYRYGLRRPSRPSSDERGKRARSRDDPARPRRDAAARRIVRRARMAVGRASVGPQCGRRRHARRLRPDRAARAEARPG
jgi:hypothetical protein